MGPHFSRRSYEKYVCPTVVAFSEELFVSYMEAEGHEFSKVSPVGFLLKIPVGTKLGQRVSKCVQHSYFVFESRL